MNRFSLFLLLVVMVLFAPRGSAQTDSTTALYKEIAAMDEILFQAFNSCDIEKYKSLLTDDLEFYHDKGGLTRGRETEAKALEKLCGGEWRVRRELVAGSMEVHPIPNYGAVQTGTHRFYETNKKEGKEKLVGIAKFLVVWRKKDLPSQSSGVAGPPSQGSGAASGQWKASHVISYDHRPAKE